MTFETLMDRMTAKAERRTTQRTHEMAAKMEAELPLGISAQPTDEGVRLIGRGLRRRFVLEPALRWMRLR